MEMFDTPQRKIIKALSENCFAHMRFFPERAEGITIVKTEGMTLIDGHVHSDTFNLVFDVKLDEEGLDAVESVVHYFRREGEPFAWWVSPEDKPEDIGDLLVHIGLPCVEERIGMYAPLEDRGAEQGILRVERVLDAQGMQDFAHIAACADQIFDSQVHTYYERLIDFSFTRDDYEQLYVGYLDEKPVTCAILTLHSKVAGIHSLITVPDQRKKGFGTAMMQELMARADHEGYALAVLLADRSLIDFYERFGFEEIAKFKVFAG